MNLAKGGGEAWAQPVQSTVTDGAEVSRSSNQLWLEVYVGSTRRTTKVMSSLCFAPLTKASAAVKTISRIC